jgi:ELWxxDGT repeat protein
MKYILQFTIFTLFTISCQAQFTLLPINGMGNVRPSSFTFYKGETYFYADGDTEYQSPFGSQSITYDLYKTNGIIYSKVKDFDSVGMSTVISSVSSANVNFQKSMIVYNGLLYFMGYDSAKGIELFVSDGTSAGTQLFKDVDTSGLSYTVGGTNYFFSKSSYPTNFYIHNGELFFTANYNNSGRELFKTNGTVAGTMLVKNINESGSYTGSSPCNFCSVGTQLFFTADDSIHSNELWKTDGTTAGTVLVKDIYEGYNFDYLFVNGSTPSQLLELNGKVIFVASDSLHGRELWQSDGTASGTFLIKDIYEGGDTLMGQYVPYYSGTIDLCKYKNEIYFRADDGSGIGSELWKTNGTNVGTVLVADLLSPSMAGSNQFGSEPFDFTVFNNKLYFKAVREMYNPSTQSLTEQGIIVAYDADLNLFVNIPNPVDVNLYPYEVQSYTSLNKNFDTQPLCIVGDKFYYVSNDKIFMCNGVTNVLVESVPEIYAMYSSGNVLYTSFNDTAINITNQLHALGLSCVANTLPLGNQYMLGNVTNQEYFISQTNCNLLARVQQTNSATSVAGAVSVSTTIFNGNNVMDNIYPLVNRSYEITPSSNASNAQGIVTLYFTQQDFNSFNLEITSVDSLLPINGGDTNGISRIRITKYTGTSNDGSANPNTYTNGMIIIDPIDSNIVWNASASRWEITILVNGFSGFFVSVAPIIASSLSINKNELQVTAKGNQIIGNFHFSNTNNIEKQEVFHRSSLQQNWEKLFTYNNIKTNQTFTHNNVASGKHYYIIHAISTNTEVQNTNIANCTLVVSIQNAVYPNPATDIVHVILNEKQPNKNIPFQLYNESGKIVQTGFLNKQNASINIGSLSNGIYLLQLPNEAGIKIVK